MIHSTISDDEKRGIREALMSANTLPANIRRQVSASIAKIARKDFPVDWPDLFVRLMTVIQSETNEEILLTHMETLKDLVKSISSQRLPKDRQNFYEVSLPYAFVFILTW